MNGISQSLKGKTSRNHTKDTKSPDFAPGRKKLSIYYLKKTISNSKEKSLSGQEGSTLISTPKSSLHHV